MWLDGFVPTIRLLIRLSARPLAGNFGSTDHCASHFSRCGKHNRLKLYRPTTVMMMLRNLFRFSPILLVLVLCSCVTPLRLNTESGQLTIAQRDIPKMYDNDYINPEYVKFLEKVFPKGLPYEVVKKDKQPFLYRYCIVLFERRDFSRTIKCLDSVRKSTDLNGDPELTGGSLGGFRFNSAGGEFPLTVREPLLRAFVLLELGNFRQSAQYADRSLQRYNDIKKKYEADQSFLPWKDNFAPGFTNLPRLLGSLPFSEIESLSNLAVIYWLSGDSDKSDKATGELRTRFASFSAVADKVYATRIRAALVRAYMTQGRYKDALEIADDEGHFLADLATLAVSGAGIALALVTRGGGQPSLPLDSLKLVFGGLDATFTDQHTIRTKFQVSHAKVEVGRYADAKPFLDEILSMDEIKAYSGIYWAVLYDRGRIAEYEGKLKDAINYYQTAIDEIERQRSTINTEGAKIGFFGDKQVVYQALVRLLFQSGKFEDAFLMGERSKSRALVDMLAKKQDFHIAAQNTVKINQLLSRAQVGEVALARDTAADTELTTKLSQRALTTGTTEKADIVAMLNEARDFKLEARKQLGAQSPELASLVSVTQVRLSELQRALPADETIVSYYYDASNLYAFLIDNAGLQAVKLERGNLEEDIRTFRKAIQKRGAYQASARALYARLIEPLQSKIKTGKLIIAGHGAIHYLPFAALSEGQRFLIDRYQLSFLPSASTLKFVGKIKTDDKPGTLLAFGNPDLGDRKYDLIFAENEAKRVAALFKNSSVFLHKEASKKNLKEYGAGFQYIHFATHGKFDADDPLDSALMLASNSVNNAQDQLTIGELYSMRFDADLVTLSACETGLGKVANGDDVVGLVRGFLFAGANQIVSTLWEISDEATSTLMTDFYQRIKAGTSKAESLRESQLAIRKDYPHPYFWAAFEITGGAEK